MALTAAAFPLPLTAFSELTNMNESIEYDVLVVGGSYSGLSAAMALGRALRKVLIIDSGLPCNRQTPHSHNFITQDGEKPDLIALKAKNQVLAYPTVNYLSNTVIDVLKTEAGFSVKTLDQQMFTAKKIIFATGVKDQMPSIEGFADCWGKSVIHCPYCHGYEVKHMATGILANGEAAYHYAQLIGNWTQDLTILTNGRADFSEEQKGKIEGKGIKIIENEVSSLVHTEGKLQKVLFTNGNALNLNAIYAKPSFEQHCKIPEQLGCELTEQGLLKVDMMQKTNVPGIFACGDNASPLRAVSYAVATGTIAGAALNNELTTIEFEQD